jgi:hypothetical protein
VVVFQVGPEQFAQGGAKSLQGHVVDRGLTFAQVVDQQISNRAAGGFRA